MKRGSSSRLAAAVEERDKKRAKFKNAAQQRQLEVLSAAATAASSTAENALQEDALHLLVQAGNVQGEDHTKGVPMPRIIFAHNSEWKAREMAERGGEVCLYDHYPITAATGVFARPLRFNAKLNRYVVEGAYCSLSCAKAAHRRSVLLSHVRNKLPAHMALFDCFAASVYGAPRKVPYPPPLELLSTLRAKLRRERPQLSATELSELAVKQWRANNPLYTNLRAVDGMFVRASAVYACETQRQRVLIQANSRAAQLAAQRPKPLLSTKRGIAKQERLVRNVMEHGKYTCSEVTAEPQQPQPPQPPTPVNKEKQQPQDEAAAPKANGTAAQRRRRGGQINLEMFFGSVKT